MKGSSPNITGMKFRGGTFQARKNNNTAPVAITARLCQVFLYI